MPHVMHRQGQEDHPTREGLPSSEEGVSALSLDLQEVPYPHYSLNPSGKRLGQASVYAILYNPPEEDYSLAGLDADEGVSQRRLGIEPPPHLCCDEFVIHRSQRGGSRAAGARNSQSH